MGCFSFIDSWFVKKKQSRRLKKLEKQQRKIEKKTETPRTNEQDEVEITKTTAGGVAFEVGLETKPKPKTRPLNAPPLKPAKTLLDTAQARAIMADIKRRDVLMRKGEAAREAERKREEYAKRRAEENRRYQERAKAIVESQVLPDEAKVKANLDKLAKRCKTARRRKQITDMLTPSKTPDMPTPSKTPEPEAAEDTVSAPSN